MARIIYDMNTKMLFRAVMLCFLAVVFCAVMLWTQQPETVPSETCLGLPFLSEEDISLLCGYRYHDYSEDLTFQKEHVAIDKENAVIYISQKIDGSTSADDLIGTLSSELPGLDMFFVRDAHWEDLDAAVRDGYGFRLLVVDCRNTYMEYEVVFTTLPVVYIYGQSAYVNEENRSVSYGRIVLADPDRLGSAESGVESAYLHWRIRGVTSSNEPKKPWKIALRNKEGKNNNVNLLGLGADDDWVLNPMNMEDTNIREKLFTRLWNEAAADTDYSYPMSRGEYVEVLVNGKYQGLYLLQRRVDDKYLELNKNQVVVKAGMVDGEMKYECFPSVNGVISEEMLDDFFLRQDCSTVNKENFVDLSLFLQLFVARDNGGYKNMFYIFDVTENGQTITMTPWDTDMTLGIKWKDNGFFYDYADALTIMNHRMELPAMEQIYPDLDQVMGERWQELRKELFTVEHLMMLSREMLQELEESGAVARDQEIWGLYHGGTDTVENLWRFLKERIEFLDTYYS